ncbi:nucleoside triphosphate pyrophosphohydrolase [candidate division KSB1 bacterium]|nr:nucleoside triphosphate pyrophosphohydrolase [candidate division KSB1 bacterium]
MENSEFQKLVEIMRTLRGKDGCPWDKEQTHSSLRQYLLEEAHEVLEALDDGNDEELRIELGDLLLQIVFHAQIASEAGKFAIGDVIRAINEKLIRRHPHVFGDKKIQTSEQQTVNWEKIKKLEGKKSVLDGVPRTLSALLRAHRIQHKAAHVGFDWQKAEDVWKKVEEEMKELTEVVAEKDQSKIESEFGDLLFALVNYSRFICVNPEDALGRTIAKFTSRFKYIEAKLRKSGKSIDMASFEEMDQLWEESKKSLP